MSQHIYRILFLLFIAAGSVRLFAQAGSSDAALWIVDSELAESTRFSPYIGGEKDGAAEDEIDVHPVTFAAGVRIRF